MAKNKIDPNLILVIGAVAGGAYLLVSQKKALDQGIGGIGSGVAQVAGGIGTGVQGIGTGVSEAFIGAGSGLRQTYESFGGATSSVLTAGGTAGSTILRETGETVESITNIPQTALREADQWIQKGNDAFQDLVFNSENQFRAADLLRSGTDQAKSAVSYLSNLPIVDTAKDVFGKVITSLNPMLPFSLGKATGEKIVSLLRKESTPEAGNTSSVDTITRSSSTPQAVDFKPVTQSTVTSIGRSANLKIAVVTPSRDASGLTKWDKIIQKNKELRR